MTITQQLQTIVGARLFENELMSKHTNFRIGGPAKWFVEVRSVEELKKVLDVAHQNALATFVFGGGSNLLASDQGFDGIGSVMDLFWGDALRFQKLNQFAFDPELRVASFAFCRFGSAEEIFLDLLKDKRRSHFTDDLLALPRFLVA